MLKVPNKRVGFEGGEKLAMVFGVTISLGVLCFIAWVICRLVMHFTA
jgi:hypothetical protein